MLADRTLRTWLLDGDEAALSRYLREATRRGDAVLSRDAGLRAYFEESVTTGSLTWMGQLTRYASVVKDIPLAHEVYCAFRRGGMLFRCGPSVRAEGEWFFEYPRKDPLTLSRPLALTAPIELDLLWNAVHIREFLEPYLEAMEKWFSELCQGTDVITDAYLMLLEAQHAERQKKYLKKAAKLAARAKSVVHHRTQKCTQAFIEGTPITHRAHPFELSSAKLIALAFEAAAKEDIAAHCHEVMEGYRRVALGSGSLLMLPLVSEQFVCHLLGFPKSAVHPTSPKAPDDPT